MNLSEIARGVFQSQLQEMRLHLEGCIEGKDPIHLHDLRVANRRTRAALTEFKKLLPEDVYQEYREDFRWIHRITGKVRDLDVFLGHYQLNKKEIAKSWRIYLEPLEKSLERKRVLALSDLSGTLQSDRVIGILESWSDILESGITGASPLSLEDAKEYGSLRIVKRYRQLQKDGQKLAKTSPAEEYHDYRIQVKNLRYLMEFYKPAMDQEEFESLNGALKSVQDVFGGFQDAEIQAHHIREMAVELAGEGVSVDALLALGQLLGVLEKQLARGRKKSLKKARWIISDANARAFQSCFQYPVD